MSQDEPWLVPFDEVYRQLAGPVYRFCLSQVGEPAAAEDVAAQAFASAFAAYQRVRPDREGLRPWIFRIARNAAIDHHRRRRRTAALVARISGRDRAREVEEEVEMREDVRRVVAAFSLLSRRDRTLVGLRLAGDLSLAEIAGVLGIGEAAARKATQRALARLRAEARP
ncbi:MAG: sigma-70 family RNA polymerase sigma factor [Candidatus Dormibacteria bacterium]